MTAAGLFSVAGRIVCVTGASSGLGRGLATALSEAGAQVVGVASIGDLSARKESGLRQTRNKLTGGITRSRAIFANVIAVLLQQSGVRYRLHSGRIRTAC